MHESCVCAPTGDVGACNLHERLGNRARVALWRGMNHYTTSIAFVRHHRDDLFSAPNAAAAADLNQLCQVKHCAQDGHPAVIRRVMLRNLQRVGGSSSRWACTWVGAWRSCIATPLPVPRTACSSAATAALPALRGLIVVIVSQPTRRGAIGMCGRCRTTAVLSHRWCHLLRSLPLPAPWY